MNAYEMKLARTVRLYPWYVFFRDCLFWAPAFFLYFASVLPLSRVLWLEAVYYVSVAILEVPSGYVSDRLGRRPTLFFSALCMVAAYLLFFSGASFWVFSIGQVLLASGFACASGTDTSLHFESLKALGREDEYVGREARAFRLAFVAGAVGAIGGGALAMISLKTVYLGSALTGVASMVLLMFIGEPPAEGKSTARSFVRQVPFLLRKSWGKRFRFFTLFAASMTLMVHVPYEFYQPYLERVALPVLPMAGAPFVTGGHLAATMLIGSWCTRFVKPLNAHCRVRGALLGCLGFQVVMVGLMALFIHPAVAILLLARTSSKAIAMPLVNAEVAPLLERSERSTYLSIQSLLGRLCYGVVLLGLPFAASLFGDGFQGTLASAALFGLFLLGCVWLTPFPRESAIRCCGNPAHHSH